jgi:hypothetical protein
LLGEWMKLTSVRSQDQRRMLQANSHTFPTNVWIHKITKKKEFDRCDLKDLPEQNLGHIQHTCETLSVAHVDGHHQCWRLIHGELARLTTPQWKFWWISGEKYLQTIWNDIPSEIGGLQYLNLTQDTIWNTTRTREINFPLTQVEDARIQAGVSTEVIAKERLQKGLWCYAFTVTLCSPSLRHSDHYWFIEVLIHCKRKNRLGHQVCACFFSHTHREKLFTTVVVSRDSWSIPPKCIIVVE